MCAVSALRCRSSCRLRGFVSSLLIVVLVALCVVLISLLVVLRCLRCLRWYCRSSLRMSSCRIQRIVLLLLSVSSLVYRLSNRLIDTIAVAPRWDWIIPSSGGCHCEIAFALMSLSVITLCASVSVGLDDLVTMCVTF